MKGNLTVALVMRKRVSCVTVSTSGDDFMMVLTRARGRLEDPPGPGDVISENSWRLRSSQRTTKTIDSLITVLYDKRLLAVF
jgi:hypothetical protein